MRQLVRFPSRGSNSRSSKRVDDRVISFQVAVIWRAPYRSVDAPVRLFEVWVTVKTNARTTGVICNRFERPFAI